MKFQKSLLALILLTGSVLPAFSRPGESVTEVLKRYGLEGAQPYTQDDYIAYKLNDPKFISQPTLYLKLGANGIVLEENFIFDKNTFHEKDVQRAKNDVLPVYDLPHQAYLIGDFTQLPRESYSALDRAAGVAGAPLGAAAGAIVGSGKGIFHGTKIGVSTANQASRALGGDASGPAAAWAGSAAGVATGAITGLFAGLTGGVVEGTARGARVGIEGFSGADRNIKGELAIASTHAVVGGRIGKELSPEEQKALLEKLAELENSRLAGGKPVDNTQVADNTNTNQNMNNDVESYLDNFDSAKSKSDFDNSSKYVAEEASSKSVAGMW